MTKQEILEKIEEFRRNIAKLNIENKVTGAGVSCLMADLKKLESCIKLVDNGKWKPEKDDHHWFLYNDGDIVEEWFEFEEESHDASFRQGNVFRTREEAEVVRDLREDMQRYDVNVGDRCLYYVSNNFKADLRMLYMENATIIEVLNQTVFKTEEDAQRRADILNRLAKTRGLIK